ncbi:MAG TPA: STAS domain-containing protein [Gemmatimonadaceae bacterium]|nr:STAS domain-containing protein [Gemmatimonadaceae bacterium]
MSIRSTREGDTVTVTIEGQLVAGNRQQLREAVLPEIDRGARHFVIDFADTGYIDSAGLGALVSLSKRIREADGTLRLTNLNEDIRTLFELTKLDTLFTLGGGEGLADSGVTANLTPKPKPAGGAKAPPHDADDVRPGA